MLNSLEGNLRNNEYPPDEFATIFGDSLVLTLEFAQPLTGKQILHAFKAMAQNDQRNASEFAVSEHDGNMFILGERSMYPEQQCMIQVPSGQRGKPWTVELFPDEQYPEISFRYFNLDEGISVGNTVTFNRVHKHLWWVRDAFQRTMIEFGIESRVTNYEQLPFETEDAELQETSATLQQHVLDSMIQLLTESEEMVPIHDLGPREDRLEYHFLVLNTPQGGIIVRDWEDTRFDDGRRAYQTIFIPHEKDLRAQTVVFRPTDDGTGFTSMSAHVGWTTAWDEYWAVTADRGVAFPGGREDPRSSFTEQDWESLRAQLEAGTVNSRQTFDLASKLTRRIHGLS